MDIESTHPLKLYSLREGEILCRGSSRRYCYSLSECDIVVVERKDTDSFRKDNREDKGESDGREKYNSTDF